MAAYQQCKNVHIWVTKKFGTKEAFLEKQQNKVLKVAVGHYPTMMMRRVPDTGKDSDDDFDNEQPVEIGKKNTVRRYDMRSNGNGGSRDSTHWILRI